MLTDLSIQKQHLKFLIVPKQYTSLSLNTYCRSQSVDTDTNKGVFPFVPSTKVSNGNTTTMSFQETCSISKSSYTADGTRSFATSTLLPQPTIASVATQDKGPNIKYGSFRSSLKICLPLWIHRRYLFKLYRAM